MPEEPEKEYGDELDNIFGLMSSIKNCKDTNKNLTDEERRLNAENIMSKLASMMDLGSDGEDGEREYGSEEN